MVIIYQAHPEIIPRKLITLTQNGQTLDLSGTNNLSFTCMKEEAGTKIVSQL